MKLAMMMLDAGESLRDVMAEFEEMERDIERGERIRKARRILNDALDRIVCEVFGDDK
jgi:hypothetical protein